MATTHEDESEGSPVVARSAIAGERDEDGTLLIDLGEVESAGYEGRAYPAPDHDDETEVFIGVREFRPAGV